MAKDDSVPVRQAAAWALGRIGGGGVKQALAEARASEKDPGVLDALEVAVSMR